MYQNHLRSSFLVGSKSDHKRAGPGTHGCVVLLNPYSANGLYGQTINSKNRRFHGLPGRKNWMDSPSGFPRFLAWCHGRSAMKHCSQDVMGLNIILQTAAENNVPQILSFWVLENAGESWDQLFWKGVPFIGSCHHLSTKHNKASQILMGIHNSIGFEEQEEGMPLASNGSLSLLWQFVKYKMDISCATTLSIL